MTRRTNGRAQPRRAVASSTDAGRRDAERRALAEIEAWRTRAIPDAAAPLEAEDLVRLLRDVVGALALDPAIAADVTVNTVRFYRRRDVIDPPEGRTAAARYHLRHLWQVAGARLAGYLGLVTLAEARDAMRDADAPALVAFLAARVADARAREAVRGAANGAAANGRHVAASSLVAGHAAGTPRESAPAGRAASPRPLPGRAAARGRAAVAAPAVTIALPDGAWCVVPAAHPALRSAQAARELVRALAGALATD